ncbi:Biotin--protein ligase [Mycetocola reblochoni REB411]|uniref:Biotin--protein ligase n=1 Tax=Mycetocola reblochoni REB411 TaxID=1255698 RepID=A0A1R4K0W1_9MICO|nr:Biotin--protein ligase [Mycetocola reblochoni REB411]
MTGRRYADRVSIRSDYPLTTAIASRLFAPGVVDSTSDELARRLVDDPALPDGTTVVSAAQRGGRGRLGRSWSAPDGTMLALSTLVDVGSIPASLLGWLPLLSGVAVADALEDVAPGIGARLKWPNDVLVSGGKIAGILCELREGSPLRAIVGIGINTGMTEDQRPVSTAGSLAMEGVDGVPDDRLASAVLARLGALVGDWRDAGGDPVGSGIAARVDSLCQTLGLRVRAELPSAELMGTALRIDGEGRLVIGVDGAAEQAVSAADITHLRAL